MSDALRLPPPLRRGDCIGIFCPAGPPRSAELLQQGLFLLHAAGFQTRCTGNLEPRGTDYLADTDAARAAALHRLWADEQIKAVLPVRGGYGCLRLAPLLDLPLLQRHCKWLIGFSDLTLLLNLLPRQAGYVTLHGPMLSSLPRCREEDRQRLFALLSGSLEPIPCLQGLEILRGGSGRGRLVGGNLTTLVHSLGTPWEPCWDGCILILEDTGEAPYRLDRMLTQLHQAGRFDRLAGLLLGDFDSGTDNPTANLRLQEQVWQRILELAPPGFPIWASLPLGHSSRNMPLPLGAEAVMDSAGGRLSLVDGTIRRA